MFNRFKLSGVLIGIAVLILLLMMFNDIRRTYIELGTIKRELSQVVTEFQQYQSLVQKVHDIDSKYTLELANAKTENIKLYRNVIDGIGRLQLNIKQTSEQTASSSMVDDTACELTGEARQNYYLLRDDLVTKDNIILALQKYITTICLTD